MNILQHIIVKIILWITVIDFIASSFIIWFHCKISSLSIIKTPFSSWVSSYYNDDIINVPCTLPTLKISTIFFSIIFTSLNLPFIFSSDIFPNRIYCSWKHFRTLLIKMWTLFQEMNISNQNGRLGCKNYWVCIPSENFRNFKIGERPRKH